MKTVTSRCSFTKSLSRLIFLLCCYLHFPAQKKCKQLQGRFPNTCKNPWTLWPPGVLLQNLFQDLSSSCAATYIFLLKKNVNSCRGGSQTPAKTHENCDLQVFFYNKTISELSNNDEISMVSGRGVTGNHNEETTTGKIGKAHERSWKIMKDHKSTNQPDPKLIKPQFILIPKSIKIHHSCKKNDLNMFEYMNCVHNRFENIQWVVSKLLQWNW